MKKLFIVRHAKSSWDYPHLPDHDRPLNKRGQRNVVDMGNRIQKRGIRPDLILSSPANRAITTARSIARAIGYATDRIREEENLYHAGTGTLKRVLSEVPDNPDTVMIFGHNPGFTSLVRELSGFDLDNLPTCGICGIAFEMDQWKEVLLKTGEKFYYDYPKSIQGL